MASSSSYTAVPQQRQNGQYRGRLSISNALPFYSSSSAVQEKYAKFAERSPWFIVISIPIPLLPLPRLRLFFINPGKLYAVTTRRFGRKRGTLMLCFFVLFLIFFIRLLFFHTGTPPTLVFKREDLQRIWQWEVATGHYPSRQRIPEELQFTVAPENPALPPRLVSQLPHETYATMSRGMGPKRAYIELQSTPENVGFPPRPVPGSVADFDIVNQHCSYERKKFVRDCLEVLRVGAGLDNGRRVRRGKLDDWKYIYIEHTTNHTLPTRQAANDLGSRDYSDPDSGLKKHHTSDWEVPPIRLRPPPQYVSPSSRPSYCDPESSRIFHIFWTGDFTDKPYLAILSFLFTQNTGLQYGEGSYPAEGACRPQFWVWINPGPAASAPGVNALDEMFSHLKNNPWSAPFLHPRFKDLVHFKMWNTTEQLDSIAELKDEWRSRDLFNSGGDKPDIPSTTMIKDAPAPSAASQSKGNPTDEANRAGSKSETTYDKLSVILSDMVRFILCHRFGGIYLDADTVLLRDWEEVWGWKGAFAYRWSRIDRYNTAVLHMNKGSALGTFVFKTALKNDLDFHPMAITQYLKEAHLRPLLLQLPDALFDPAWLTTEDHLERPPQPFFTSFNHFFETPPTDSAAPQALGFEGFFRGAYSYHYHNYWWKPFDPIRNWPDLGPQFAEGEKKARLAQRLKEQAKSGSSAEGTEGDDIVGDDRRDLDWAAVLKRLMEAYVRGERPNMYGEMMKW